MDMEEAWRLAWKFGVKTSKSDDSVSLTLEASGLRYLILCFSAWILRRKGFAWITFGDWI